MTLPRKSTRRGRPPKKAAKVAPAKVPEKAAAPPPPPPADGSLLARNQALAASLEASLATAQASNLARESAQLGQALSRCYQQIGKLTGEGEVSEAMVVASTAFQRLLMLMRDALREHPAAAKSVLEALRGSVGSGARGLEEDSA